MAVSDRKLVAEIVVAGEEPRVFDDIGCLSAYLKDHRIDGHAAVFVADHRTGDWVAAQSAIFTYVDRVETPMGSHLVAHADGPSRDADPIARGGHTAATNTILRLAR